MFPILLQIGPFTLHTYGLLVALGFLGGYVIARNEFRARHLPLDLLDKSLYIALFGGLFGARLFFVLFVARDYFLSDPLSFFRIWEGGLVFYGGFLFALVLLLWFARYQGVSYYLLGDALAAPLALAHAVGRLGCFSAGCCYGRDTESFLAVVFTHPESLAPLNRPLIPTQLLEAGGDFLLFLFLLIFGQRKRPNGLLIASYLLGYGALRFAVEFLRGDYRGVVISGLYPSQWISLLLFSLGLFLLTRILRKSYTVSGQ